MLDVLAHIQTHLDGDLSLDELSRIAQLSPFEFQRRFKAIVGETPRRHVERIRLERAAAHLVLRDASVLDVAIEHGFKSHEVFTRAFRRHFKASPSTWRSSWREQRHSRKQHVEQSMKEGSLSTTRILEIKAVHVAFIRHVGPYENVPMTMWRDLVKWASLRNIPQGPLLGVAHDAPGLVEDSKLRFDACMVVPPETKARGKVAITTLAGGLHAVTTYIGPASGIALAYGEIGRRLLARKDLELVGLPALEHYESTQILGGSLESIEIALPVR